MCPFRLISERPSAHSSMMHSIQVFSHFMFFICCFALFCGFIDSHSHSILRDAFFYLVASIDGRGNWREKSSRQSRELEVFSFISWLTMKIPKALRDRKPSYSISTCIHRTLCRIMEKITFRRCYLYFITHRFSCVMCLHMIHWIWIKFKAFRETSAFESDTPSLWEQLKLVESIVDRILRISGAEGIGNFHEKVVKLSTYCSTFLSFAKFLQKLTSPLNDLLTPFTEQKFLNYSQTVKNAVELKVNTIFPRHCRSKVFAITF